MPDGRDATTPVGRAHGVGSGANAHPWADPLAEPDALHLLSLTMADGHLANARLELRRRTPRTLHLLEQAGCAVGWLTLALRLSTEVPAT